MSARARFLALPLLFGCNALLNIDAHDLASTGGAAGRESEAGRASDGSFGAGGSLGAQGGAGFAGMDTPPAFGGGDDGTPPEGGDTSLGGSTVGLEGGRYSAGGKDTATGATSNAGGSPSGAAGSATSGGTMSVAGSTNRAGASSTGGNVTANDCDLKCPSAKICVEGRCVDCRNGERRCGADGTPLACVNHAWSEQTACSGATPLCSNGTCVGMRLTGGLVTVQASARSTSIRLVEGSLELAKPSCSTALGKCVVGGLRP